MAVGRHDGDELAGDEQVLVADLLVGVECEVVLLGEVGRGAERGHGSDLDELAAGDHHLDVDILLVGLVAGILARFEVVSTDSVAENGR